MLSPALRSAGLSTKGTATIKLPILNRREGLLSDANDELARDVPLGADCLSRRRLLEREGLLNTQAEKALGTKPSNFGEDSLRIFRRPVTELHAVLGSREIGDGKHARSIPDDFDQLWNDPRAGDIEGSVHALGREAPHPFRQARSVGGRDGAQPAHVVVLWRARRADDGNPAEARELDDGRANSTGSSAHQKRLAGFHTELLETAPRRFDDHGEPTGNLERHVVWLVSPVSENRILGHRVRAVAEHGVADQHVRDAWADLVHDARRLEADAGGQRDRRGITGISSPIFPVRRVDPGGPDCDPHLTRASMRLIDVDDTEDLWASVFAVLHCFHELLRSHVDYVLMMALRS